MRLAPRPAAARRTSFALLTVVVFFYGCGQSEKDRRAISTDLDTAAEYLSVGGADKIASAAKLYRGILERDPANAEARFGLGKAELLSNRTWAGLWHMVRLLHDQPAHAGALRALGLQAYSEGRYEDAFTSLDSLSRVRELDPAEAIAFGDACNHTNRFTAADSAFAATIARFGEEPRALEAWGYAISKLGNLEKATVPISRAIEINPKLTSARLALATLLQDLDRFEESEKILAGASPSSDSESAKLETLMAKAREQAGDLQGAARHLNNAVRMSPGDGEPDYVLARVLRRLNDLEGAKNAALRHRERLQIAEERTATYALNALSDGAIAEEKGDVDKAIAIYRDGLDVQTHTMLLCALEPYPAVTSEIKSKSPYTLSPQSFIATGKELRRRGIPTIAARQFEFASTKEPHNEEAIYFHALTLAELGDWKTALRIAQPLEQQDSPR